MRKLILASHGNLAEGMESAVRMILGDSTSILAYGLDTWQTPQSILEQIKKDMERCPDYDYIILCDIKSGSVHNTLMELCCLDRVGIVTGMNLSLAVELAVSATDNWREEIEGMIEMSREGIQWFSKDMIVNFKDLEGEDELW